MTIERMTSITKLNAPTTSLDLMSEAVADNPWPLLREVREQGPVVWHTGYNRWMITTDREVRKVVSDFRNFTVEKTTVEDLFGADAFISSDDRVYHDQLRNVWMNAFRKQGLDTLRPTIQTMVDGLIKPIAERLHAGETVELSKALCRPLPTLVIAMMMGVPDAMLPDVVRWSDEMAAGGSAYLPEDEVKRLRQTRDDAKAALAEFLTEQIVARRSGRGSNSGSDLISIMVQSDAAKKLSDPQLVQNVRQLLFAGNETTAKWLAQVFVTYAQENDARREMVSDRALVRAANDEVMRWQGVVGSLVRRVRNGPIEIAGVELADGDDVTCLLIAANRDPERYENPDQFNIHRPHLPNLGFGFGFHNCLGLALAKLEVELAVNGILDTVPEFALAGPYHYSSIPLRGPLPVMIAKSSL